MVITTVFLRILLLSFNHLSDEFIFSKSSEISQVSSKGVAEDIISEKNGRQNRGNMLGFERTKPTAEVNTSEQCGVGKSHPHLADAHHDDREGRDDHNNDRHDHDRGNDDRHDHDDDNGWFDDDGNHHDHDHDRDYHGHDHDHDRH
jgi:hypothetical protein